MSPARKKTSNQIKSGSDPLEALFAAVWSAPDDDAPRLVLADALTERADPRGEFMVLQIARANGKATNEMRRRERELRAKLKSNKAFGAPFPSMGVHFERGMPVAVSMGKAAAALAGHPAWSTVGKLDLPPAVKRTELAALLTSPSLAHLREVGSFRYAADLDALGGVPGRWTSVQLDFMPTVGVLERMPKLEQLFVVSGSKEPDLLPSVLPALSRLRSLRLLSVNVPPDALAQLASLEELAVMNALPIAALRGCRKLRQLELEELTDDPLWAQLPLESLNLTRHDPSLEVLAKVLERLPRLMRLELRTFEESRPALFALLRSTKVEELTVNGDVYRDLRSKRVTVETYVDAVPTLNLAALPKGTIGTLRVVPMSADPGFNFELPPTPRMLADLSAELAPLKIEVVDNWW
ncbi:MAG: TIGR02996 domain-containing protein [Archangium sp.]|nr:TIGR02996 domain-containing protein [Archangium sp.]MDP3574299.1 TIGR02996 domain-containing protein [Archangium sp.]